MANVIGFLVFGKRFNNSSTDFQKRLNLIAESILLVRTPLAQVGCVFCYIYKIIVYQTVSKTCISQASKSDQTDRVTFVLFWSGLLIFVMQTFLGC